MDSVPYITDFHSINPYILVRNIDDYFSFLKSVFGAKIIKEIHGSEENYMEVKIEDTTLMVQECKDEFGFGPISLWIYVKDVKFIFDLCVKNGSTVLKYPTLQFGKDIVGKIIDPFGVAWYISSYIN